MSFIGQTLFPILNPVFDKLKEVFLIFGLRTPLLRFIAVGFLSGAALLYQHPSVFFNQTENGYESKPWIMISDDPEAIYFPWWIWALLSGILAAGF